MARNLLIFDAEYVAELTARMNSACELLSGAVTDLKNASNHENWKCKERTQITGNFEELNIKLDRLDKGVNETTRILGNSVSRFAALESRYSSQEHGLSDELTTNHGYSGTVRTEGGTSGGVSGQVGAATGTAGAAGAVAGTPGTSGTPGRNGRGHSEHGTGAVPPERPGRPGGSTGVNINAGGNMFRERNQEMPTSPTGSSAPTGGAVPTNLPVTYIPNNPGAVAKGTKGTREVAEAAVNSVVGTMTAALVGGKNVEASKLANAYNAGRSIFESSAAIISSPSQSHTNERLTMAEGLVTLVQNSQPTVMTTTITTSSVTENAQRISSALQDDGDSSEFSDLLSVILGDDTVVSATSSRSSGGSFFDMIVDAIKQTLSEGQTTASSSSTNSPITRFFENFVMDEAV